MTSIREFAPAKVNLTLHVAGRQADGYHRLASLTTFASVGDTLTFEPGLSREIVVSGPFASELSRSGLSGRPTTLDAVFDLIVTEVPDVALGRVHLEKNLPIAAGLGGGSADAAALIRAVRRASPKAAAPIDWPAFAARIGADVPVCLASRPLWMTGVGHDLADIPGGVPPLAAVLVNPLAHVPDDKTARVFRTLGAGSAPHLTPRDAVPAFADRAALLDFMRAVGNDLEDAAATVVPEIRKVLAALASEPGVEHAALSGAGPTCFGVFADEADAARARGRLAAAHPDWWVVAVTLG
ncbi:4-(cytidine 5'-diphospho)-2-C-methyl-D-erythritol kinase [Hyphomicrobium sp.]|uniref:4-(cytidine 5'-diphospho)-2-C-methyl-D-erythritol kinase n=1 Tax=Hyphomicrobium sp. TaxID=82 RepID=UPI003F6EB784